MELGTQHRLPELHTKVCPRCKQAFQCQVEAGCWCEKLNLHRDVLKKLRQEYIDCLCESCLKSFETHKN